MKCASKKLEHSGCPAALVWLPLWKKDKIDIWLWKCDQVMVWWEIPWSSGWTVIGSHSCTGRLPSNTGGANWHHRHSILHTHTHQNVFKSKRTMWEKKSVYQSWSIWRHLWLLMVMKIFFTDQFKKACIITGGSTHSMSQIQQKKNNCCVCLKHSQTNHGQGWFVCGYKH